MAAPPCPGLLTACFSCWKIAVKSSNRWLLRLVVLLVVAVVAGSFFRYEYTSDKSVRVDRLTGAQEVFCQAQQSWTSVSACYASVTPQPAPER